ncbi:hypothetical protein ACVI1L_000918 [Bradyrhizobium sp. USDA 4516]|nr:hypothetical protein [Bradyrhizobium sp. USDA 4541]
MRRFVKQADRGQWTLPTFLRMPQCPQPGGKPTKVERGVVVGF